MSFLERFANAWLDWTIAASWQLALLVCLIAVLTYALRGASPRLRYGLWLLVLLKAFLPPTLTTFWGVGAWGIAPVVDAGWQNATDTLMVGAVDRAPDSTTIDAAGITTDTPAALIRPEHAMLVAWASGCLALWLAVAWRYRRITQLVRTMRRIDEGPARIELERLAARFAIRNVPDIYVTERATSPMLLGTLEPKIVLPESLLENLDAEKLRMILAHELVHWRRYDTWVGWLQVLVQGVFWFHPLVWFANARIRHERECACDETVLREAPESRDGYGETIIRVLTAARGRSLVAANLVGVFERGSRLQTRLEEIMSFDPKKRRFGWLSRAALVAIALVVLPMAAPGVQPERSKDSATTADESATNEQAAGNVAARRLKTNWPTIVSTEPKIGATDVDPSLKEITVTFDRDMDVGGYSWTGGGEFYPTVPEGQSAVWTDKRTCALPVQLKKGSFYRVGINSTSFRNFKSELGVPAETAAIYFATEGASRGVANRVRVPKVIEMSPENGVTDVDPGVKVIRVTFDVAMDTSSYSWTGGGPTFPKIPDGQKPRWSRDGKSCILPVQLQPGTKYKLGLNSVSHKNFASKWGVPLEPVRYEFQTSGEATDVAETPADPNGPPQIVKMVPENGAKDVDPALREIVVTFDRPMAAGFSWTGGGEHFPTIPQGKKPSWSSDKKTCTLPVELKPNWQYRLGLNSQSFKNFASADGTPLEPVVYEFHTSPANE
jgi:beta-lactamase regulating signal transducer with metallopeptidase domain